MSENNTPSADELERELEGLEGDGIDMSISPSDLQVIQRKIRADYVAQFHAFKEASIINRTAGLIEDADRQADSARKLVVAIRELDKRMSS